MSQPTRIVWILAAAIFALTAGVAQAGSPAMVSPESVGNERVEMSFAAFAQGWVERAQVRNDAHRSSPRAQRAAAALMFAYRSIGDDFETELQPTGRPLAPFVGVLRYTEHTHLCSDAAGRSCRIASSLPVTEVFRFRGGRWTY